MSDIAMSDETVQSPTSGSKSSPAKELNLTCSGGKDYSDRAESPDVYKNNNNNNNNNTVHSVSPPPPRRDVGNTNFSIDSQLHSSPDDIESQHKPAFKTSDSVFPSEDYKMNISPKERERTLSTVMEEDQEETEFSPKTGGYPPSSGETVGGFLKQEGNDYTHLAATLQQGREKNLHADFESSKQEAHRLQSQRFGHHDFMRSQDQNEMSENEEEMACDDYESDSDTNEPRITVREALMNRALAAAAAAAAGTTSTTSHYGGERATEIFAEQGGSGRTSRSGGISPSSSPGIRSSSTSGIASGRNNESSSSGSSHINSNKDFINGHVGLRPPVSHSGGDRYYPQHSSSHGHHPGSHQRSFSYGAPHLSSPHQMHGSSSHSFLKTGSSGSKHGGQMLRESPGVKSEMKSHSSSPLQSEVKPENLAALSNLSNIQNLLNLASLGSLAALQQSLPGLLSSVSSSGSGQDSQRNNGPSSSPSHISPHSGIRSSSSPSPAGGMTTPLNLTHSSSSGTGLTSTKSHSSHNNNSSNNHHSSRGQHSTSPFPHQSPFPLSSGNPSAHPGGNLIPPNLAAYFSQAAAVAGRSGSPSSPFLSNSSLPSSLTQAASNAQSPGSLPQLVLASGQLMQGIQGAQLLIPTSQGIMTQMILTIPLTQPGSPSTTAQNAASPAIGSATGQRSSSPHGRSASRSQGRSLHHGLPQCSANSPPIASTVPPSASPDYSGPGGSMSGSLLNLSPHLVNQSLGAHIPLDKMGMDRSGSMNGMRPSSMKRDSSGSVISPNPNLPMSSLYPSKMSPCSDNDGGHDSDKCSEGGDSDQMVDGINLDEIKEFAKAFKLRRLSLGLTQTQVGQALSVTEGPAYSQSAICSALAWQLAQNQSQLSQSNRTSLPQPSMFEKLDITPKSAQKIKPVLERWMKEAEDRYKNGHQNLNEFVGMEPSKKRKRRTSFTPQALEILNTQFERNTHPSGAEITTLAHQLGYEREVIRIWFCNKRQALKNTVRMMSKGSSPI